MEYYTKKIVERMGEYSDGMFNEFIKLYKDNIVDNNLAEYLCAVENANVEYIRKLIAAEENKG